MLKLFNETQKMAMRQSLYKHYSAEQKKSDMNFNKS